MKSSAHKLDYFTWFLILFLAMALAFLTVMTGGCVKTVTVEKPVMVPMTCDLPPSVEKPELTFEGAPPCPESHPVCMTAAVATQLAIYLLATETWMEEVRALCGEEAEDDLLPLGAPESAPDG